MCVGVHDATDQGRRLYTYGDVVGFKSGKVFMNFAIYDDYGEKSSKKHLSYPRNSKLVVKFANDSVIEVKSFGDVIQTFEPTYGVKYADEGIEYTGRDQNPYYRPWISDVRPPIMIFYTGRHYLLEDTDMQKLLMWPIVKVEVELADGQKKDFKVGKKHGKKVLKGLQNCWRSLK